jgi:NADH:ubiquinone oxidoreductase subunit E
MRPLGRHVIKMCKSVPCYLKNNRPVIDAVEKELGVGPGQTSRDGLFSLQMVNCIGACDKAPAMMIDDEVFGDLTPERVPEILARYR